jgi:hypothetical protein
MDSLGGESEDPPGRPDRLPAWMQIQHSKVDYVTVVLDGIDRCEDRVSKHGYFQCDTLTLVEETSLDPVIVDTVLDFLWARHRIEAKSFTGAGRPFLTGIRRVLPTRPRLWGEEGRYQGR